MGGAVEEEAEQSFSSFGFWDLDSPHDVEVFAC
jgi:hypothetical protein